MPQHNNVYCNDANRDMGTRVPNISQHSEGVQAVSDKYGKHSLREDVVHDGYEHGFSTS